jgi:hypothetical protein
MGSSIPKAITVIDHIIDQIHEWFKENEIHAGLSDAVLDSNDVLDNADVDPEDTPALSSITKADGARGTITVQLLDALKRTVEGLVHLSGKKYTFQVEHISTLRLENLFGTMRENPSAGNYPTALEYVRVYSKSIKELLKKSLNGQYAFLYSTWVRTRRYNQPTPLANGRASIIDILPKKSRIHRTHLRKAHYQNANGEFNQSAFLNERQSRDRFVESLYTLLAILGKPVRQNRIRALSKHVAGVLPYSISYVHRDLGRTPPRETQPPPQFQDDEDELSLARQSDVSSRRVDDRLAGLARPSSIASTDDNPYRLNPPRSNTTVNIVRTPAISAPRGRGRPPKSASTLPTSTTATLTINTGIAAEMDSDTMGENHTAFTVFRGRGRGRPRGSTNKSALSLTHASSTSSLSQRGIVANRRGKRPMRSAIPLIDETVYRKGDIVVSKSGQIYKLGSHIYKSRTNQTLRPAEVQSNIVEAMHEPGCESTRETKWRVSRAITTLITRDIRSKRTDFEPDKFVADVYHSRVSLPAYALASRNSMDDGNDEQEEEEEEEYIDDDDNDDNGEGDEDDHQF